MGASSRASSSKQRLEKGFARDRNAWEKIRQEKESPRPTNASMEKGR